MTISFYTQPDDLFLIHSYITDYSENDENVVIYISNQPTNPTDVLVSVSIAQYNELVDLDLIEWL
jgi:hypothetical protein